MMTVYFETGFALQINEGFYAERSQNFTDIYDKKDPENRRWITQVPNTAFITNTPVCRAYNANENLQQSNQITELTREVRLLKRTIARKGKL